MSSPESFSNGGQRGFARGYYQRGQRRGGRSSRRGRGRGCGPCGPGGAGRGFMGMMKNFMEKMGGEEQCKQMKTEFCETMKNGDEA